MPARLITSGQDANDRRRREHVDHAAARSQNARVVTPRRPGQQRIAADTESCAAERDESTVRQGVDVATVPALGAALQALAVKHLIHIRSAGAPAATTRFAPIFGKSFRFLSPAFEAGPVPGGERGRLVEKEQLGVEPPPYVALPPFEREHAADPLPRSPAPRRERPRRGVKPPAAIAHESAARRVGKKFAERIDAILQRHCR